MKARFQWYKNLNNIHKQNPFRGEYLEFERIPNVGENIFFSNTKYTVKNIMTEIRGWKFYYTIYIE